MVSQKKDMHPVTVIEEASNSLEESVAKEERKTPVTQVVEILDDAPAQEVSSPEDSEVKDILEHSVDSVEQDEKRKELVDELFQKKSTTPVGVMPEISVHSSQKKNPIVFWAIGIVSACIAIGISLVLISGKKLSLPSIVVVPTVVPTKAQATPTPSPAELKRDAITIEVLNGGGKSGAATKMKKALEDKGYVVKNTGNTEEYTYDKTEIHVKVAQKDFLALLLTDLKDGYTFGTSAADLEVSVVYDVRVIVGKE